MKKNRLILTHSFAQLFSVKLLGFLLILGLACSFIALQLMYGLIRNSNAKSDQLPIFCSFAVLQDALLHDAEPLKTLEASLRSYGAVTFLCSQARGDNIAKTYTLFGYSGYYRPGQRFAESEGRFFTPAELAGSPGLVYWSFDISHSNRKKLLPEGFLSIGDGGCISTLILEQANLPVPTGDGIGAYVVAMQDFFSLAGSANQLSVCFTPYDLKDASAIHGILSGCFPEAVIVPPAAPADYFLAENTARFILCAAVCFIALINILHLYLYIVRRAKTEMSVFTLCGARAGDLYAFVTCIWTLAALFAFILSQSLLFALYFPLSRLELFSMPSFALSVLSFAVTWLFPYLVCFTALRRQIGILYLPGREETT
jgi:hypothetical protein